MFITADDAEVLRINMRSTNNYRSLPGTATSLNDPALIPMKAGVTKLRILQQFRKVDPTDPGNEDKEELVDGATSRQFAWDVTITKKEG